MASRQHDSGRQILLSFKSEQSELAEMQNHPAIATRLADRNLAFLRNQFDANAPRVGRRWFTRVSRLDRAFSPIALGQARGVHGDGARDLRAGSDGQWDLLIPLLPGTRACMPRSLGCGGQRAAPPD